MLVTIHCVHCGKSLAVPEELAGKRVRCVECRGVFLIPDRAVLRPVPLEPPSDLTSAALAMAREEVVSRSMLMPPVGMAAAASAEWIARLEPGTLRWLETSPGLAEFLGRKIDPLDPRTLLDDLHPDDCVLAADEFRQAAELGERHGFILRIRNRSAEWRYVRIYPQARYEPSGRINHIRCNLKDVTDRVHAEQELRRRTEQLTAANEQLRQANHKLAETQGQLVHSEKLAALGTLAAGMAHEINNPLAFALNNVTVLTRDIGQVFRLVALYEECLEEIRSLNPARAESIAAFRAAVDIDYLRESLPRLAEAAGTGLRRVAQIVQNLRDFAQLDRAAIGDVNINESIEQALGMLAENLARQRVTVVRDFHPLTPTEGAGAQLNQLFLNLLLNALQAIEQTGRPAGRIEVVTRQSESDGHIVVEIADDGCGIPAELRARIFDPFFTTKPVGHGTGLGLSLSLGIVNDHGGRIEVESIPGAGSRFRVLLPVRSTH
jgi:signal transduction histidine kinase